MKKFKRCILHIGSGKTGTSTIQKVMFKTRNWLDSIGYYYPLNHSRHFFLEGYVSENPHKKQFYRTSFQTKEKADKFLGQEIKRLKKDMSKSNAHTIVFSNETFHTMKVADIKKMSNFLSEIAEQVTVVCYVREPIAQSASLMQELVKGGDCVLESTPPAQFKASKSLPKYVEVFGKENIVVREFNRKTLYQEDVLSDFCKIIGFEQDDIDELRSRAPSNSNVGICHEAMMIASELNKTVPLIKGKKVNKARAKEFRNVLGTIEGTKFQLPPQWFDIVNQQKLKDEKFLQDEFGFSFKETPAKPKGGIRLWQPKTAKSIAHLLNSQLKTIEELKLQLSQLGKDAKLRKQDKTFNDFVVDNLKSLLDNDPRNIQALEMLIDVYLYSGSRESVIDYIRIYLKYNLSIKTRISVSSMLHGKGFHHLSKRAINEAKSLNPITRYRLKKLRNAL